MEKVKVDNTKVDNGKVNATEEGGAKVDDRKVSNTHIGSKKVIYMKAISLSLLLFLEALAATSLLFTYSMNSELFSMDFILLLKLGLMLLIIIYTYSLTIGVWDEWVQFVIIPLPISLGIMVIFVQINLLYAVLAFLLSYMIITYEVFSATYLKTQLITFNPRIALRTSTKGLLFLFALVGALIIFINPHATKQLDIGESIGGVAQNQMELIISQNENMQLLQGFGIMDFNIQDLVAEKINNLLEPYKDYIIIVFSMLALGMFTLVNFVIYLFFSLTVGGVFYLAKKVGFLKVEFQEVQQEVLRF